MKVSLLASPYARLLVINGMMAISFLSLCVIANLLGGKAFMGMMLLAALFACLCFVVEVVLGVVAIVRGQLLLAVAYGLLSLLLFYADSWLLEQME